MRKIRTLNKRVLIERTPYAPFEQTRTGLWLPASAREKPQTGRIAAVSTDSELRVGNAALLPKYSDRRLDIDGRECEIVPEDELLLEIETSSVRIANTSRPKRPRKESHK